MAEFATVATIKGSGTVYAVDARGNARALKAGDTLQKGETVRTTGDARVELLVLDGSLLVVGPMESVLLDAQLVEPAQGTAPQENAVPRPGQTIDDILEALERGSDLSEELDPAAAGLNAAAGGNDGGHSFVRLGRIVEPLEPLQYQYGFRAPEPVRDIPRAPQAPAPDDQPQVTLAARGGVTTDETTDLNVTRSGAVVDVSAQVGDDAEGASVNVQLVIDQADSGLQTATGHDVALVPGADDNVVLGMFDSNGDGVLDTVAFTLAISDEGVLSVTQHVALTHGVPGDFDEGVNLDGRVSVRVTVVDGDGDTATQSVSVGDRVVFEDDGPSIDVGLASGVEPPAVVTQDADTVGSAFDTASGSASFASLFTITASGGADQPGVQSAVYTLSIGEGKEVSGLTSNGQAITLVMDGGDIVGRAGDGSAATDVFRVSVSADGTITLTQYAQVDHLPESLNTSNDNALVVLPAGSVILTASASVTDADQDRAADSQAVDISNAIGFQDDLPSVDVSTVRDAAITLTTQDAQTIGADSDAAQANFGAAFLAAVTAGSGADAPASTEVNGFHFNLLGTDTGLTSQGAAISLVLQGGDVIGRATIGGTLTDVFRLHVDGTTGEVTLTQYTQVDHLPESLNTSNDNTIELLPNGLVQLVATATVTDYDQDQATSTVSADLGGNIAFDDDVPNITVGAVADGAIVLTTQDAQTIGTDSDTAQADFGAAFLAAVTAGSGADAPASTEVNGFHFNLLGTDTGLTSQGAAISLVLQGGDVIGRATIGGTVTDVFRLHVDGATGEVTLTQYTQVDHLPESLDTSNDNTTELLPSGLVQLVATATVTDYDQDQATSTVSADLGGNIAFDDDVPSINMAAVADAAIVLTTQDAQTIGADSNTAQANFGAAFLAAVTAGAGADAPASTEANGFHFNLLGTDTGLTSQGAAITLVLQGGDVVGRATLGGTLTDVFRLHVDGTTGEVTLTQYTQVDHLPETLDTSNDNTTELLPNGLVQLVATATVTDYDQDQATSTVSADLGGNIAFDDDVPSINVGTVADSAIVLATQDAQTIGTDSDTAQASFGAAFLAAVTAGPGADAPASTEVNGFHLNLLGTDTGLTSQGAAITLVLQGGDVIGRATIGGTLTDVFRLHVDGATGEVTLTQYSQVDHLPESLNTSNDNTTELLPSGLVQLVATATVTDYDQDQATSTVSADLGGNIAFDDDVPSINVGAVADSAIVLTTQDAQTIGTDSDAAQANFGAAFLAAVTAGSGADAPASTEVNGFHFNLLGTDTGLTSQGAAITLVLQGGDVVGRATIGGTLTDVFRLHVDGTTGEVTLTQYTQVDHLPESLNTSNDNTTELLPNGLVQLVATATVTDYDQDQATSTVSADLGGNIAFDDDVPSINVGTVADSAIVLTTQDAQTIGTDSDTAQASFGAAFLAAVTAGSGADAPASTEVNGFHFNLLGTDTGLTSQGAAISLVLQGGDVIGRATIGGTLTDVFRLHVDGATGEVTLTQYSQVDHLPESLDTSNDNTTELLPNGLVQLVATATVTDYDQDQATSTVTADLGGNIAFDDDVPSINVGAVADSAIVLTTQDAQTIGTDSDTAQANFAAAFLAAVTSGSGADAPASTEVNGFHFNLLGTDTGLTSQGAAISLVLQGGEVIGRATIGGTLTDVFRLHVDGATGELTLTQYTQVDHLPESLNTSNDNTTELLPNGLVQLVATATVTDYDQDQATSTVSADLGGNIAFDDDVPSITVGAVADSAIVLTTQDAQTIGADSDTAQANFAAAFLAAVTAGSGADAPASTEVNGFHFNLLGTDTGLTSQGAAISLVLQGADVIGRATIGGTLTDVFRLHVDGATGEVTLTQYTQVDHLPESLNTSNDNTTELLPNGLVQLVATATVTDYDQDQATSTVSADLGGNIAFDDDVPSLTVGAVADSAIVLTTQDAQTIGADSDTAQANFAAAFLSAVTAFSGADAPASATTIGDYRFNVQTTSSGLTSGGLAVVLVMDGNDVVGRTSEGGVSTDVFRLHVDTTSGEVTLTQYQHIDHLPEDVDGVDDNSNIALATGVLRLEATATVADADNDQVTATVGADLGGNVSFDDDLPTVIQPMTAYVVNQTGVSGSIADLALDADGSVQDNFGADVPGAVRFLAHAGDSADVTTGAQPVYLYTSADGLTLLGSTLAGSSFEAAWADRSGSGAFVVTLDPAAGAENYDFQLLKQIDGGIGTFSTDTGSWAFSGGNTDYVYYEDLSGQNLPSVLLTPAEGYRLNGTASEIGISGPGPGQNIGSNEAVRVDFVTNISGTPTATTYVAPSTHQFDEHVLVNGAAVVFALANAAARTTVNFRVFDDADAVDALPGEDDTVGDYQEPAGTSETVTRVVVNGTVYTGDFSTGGFAVDFLGDGSVDVSGIKDGDSVSVFTADGFTTVEYHYVSGDTFALSGFGASAFDPGALSTLSFDLGVYDSDGDLAIVNDGLQVLLSPDDQQVVMGTAAADNLMASAGQAMTYVGLGGDDVLTGNTGNDILVGGQGDDELSGGSGTDTAIYLDALSGVTVDLAAGSAGGGDGSDTLTGIEDLVGSRYGDTLLGNALSNTLLGEAGADSLAGAGGGDRLVGGSGSDTLSGGAGNDILTGGSAGVSSDLESDTFAWRTGDAGTAATPSSDLVRDMRLGTGGDALDLRDLLEGELAGTDLAAAQSLDQYLRFTEVDGRAVLEVDPNAGSFAPTQTITFGNMSLSDLTASLGLPTTATDVDIIRQMLEQGNLRNGA